MTYKQRIEAAFQLWKKKKGMFYKSPGHDFRTALESLQSFDLLKTEQDLSENKNQVSILEETTGGEK